MKTSIHALPTLNDDKDVRIVIELGKQSALLAMAPHQAAREITDVLMRAELDAGNFLDRLRTSAQPVRRASQLPSVTSIPSCTGCGSSVEKAGDLCPVCWERKTGTGTQGPQATIALVSQGEPLYKREGNFRDAPSEREETTS